MLSGNITITGAGVSDAANRAVERDQELILKNCAPFTDCISEINNTQVDHGKDNDVGMPMYNLIEYSDNYSKISGSLWQQQHHQQMQLFRRKFWIWYDNINNSE